MKTEAIHRISNQSCIITSPLRFLGKHVHNSAAHLLNLQKYNSGVCDKRHSKLCAVLSETPLIRGTWTCARVTTFPAPFCSPLTESVARMRWRRGWPSLITRRRLNPLLSVENPHVHTHMHVNSFQNGGEIERKPISTFNWTNRHPTIKRKQASSFSSILLPAELLIDGAICTRRCNGVVKKKRGSTRLKCVWMLVIHSVVHAARGFLWQSEEAVWVTPWWL